MNPDWGLRRPGAAGEQAATFSTSYGHNVELAWLLNRAAEVGGWPSGRLAADTRGLVDHSLRYGFDERLGGVYDAGPYQGPPYAEVREWWQNAESLVGYLDAYERLGDGRYLEAFRRTWESAKAYLIHPRLGEWRVYLDRDERVIKADLGHPMKTIYLTGRALIECCARLQRMLAGQKGQHA